MYSPRGRLSLLRAVEDGKLELTARRRGAPLPLPGLPRVQHRLPAGRAHR